MKSYLLIILALFVFETILAQKGKTYHVNTNSLNVRAEPSTESEIIDKIQLNNNVIIVNDSTPKWYKIKFGEKEGFASKEFLSKGKCVVSNHTIRTGAVCKDGTSSKATGRGACSHHGGVAYWKTQTKKSTKIVYE